MAVNQASGKESRPEETAKSANAPFGGKRGRRKDYGYDLTEMDKLSLLNLSAAKKACVLASEQIRKGNEVNGKILEAASVLAGSTASLLADR